MNAKDNESPDAERISLPGADPSDLRGRQSVRATFKLSEDAINTLSLVAAHLGIKQKSLFDHLIDDDQSLSHIAREIAVHEFKSIYRIQKTYVLSRKALSSLERACRTYNTPRDMLVEYSIQRLVPVISRERAKHRKRKEIMNALESQLSSGLRLLELAENELGPEDPMCEYIDKMVSAIKSAHRNVLAFIDRGSGIEDMDLP